MKKYAIIGKGKTGQSIISALGTSRIHAIFSSSNPVTIEGLKGADAAIVFIPSEGLTQVLPILLESKLPVICGTTGFSWPKDFSEKLISQQTTWITGNNFSPGMNFLFTIAHLIQKNKNFLGTPTLQIHEIHHIHKKDSPSGTALHLSKILGEVKDIHAERIGDHRGLHEIMVSSPLEILTLKHEALDRKAFAEGAIFAADTLIPQLKPGLYSFESLMEKKILGN